MNKMERIKLRSLHYKITKMQDKYNKAHSAYLALEEVRKDIHSMIKEDEKRGSSN